MSDLEDAGVSCQQVLNNPVNDKRTVKTRIDQFIHLESQKASIKKRIAGLRAEADRDPAQVERERMEQDFYDAERRSFLTLVSGSATRERINSMLDAGSPVRN